MAAVSQREVGTDTESFPAALRSVLREDPDVVLVGEMRDLESIAACLTIAETGHLVIAICTPITPARRSTALSTSSLLIAGPRFQVQSGGRRHKYRRPGRGCRRRTSLSRPCWTPAPRLCGPSKLVARRMGLPSYRDRRVISSLVAGAAAVLQLAMSSSPAQHRVADGLVPATSHEGHGP